MRIESHIQFRFNQYVLSPFCVRHYGLLSYGLLSFHIRDVLQGGRFSKKSNELVKIMIQERPLKLAKWELLVIFEKNFSQLGWHCVRLGEKKKGKEMNREKVLQAHRSKIKENSRVKHRSLQISRDLHLPEVKKEEVSGKEKTMTANTQSFFKTMQSKKYLGKLENENILCTYQSPVTEQLFSAIPLQTWFYMGMKTDFFFS